MTKKAIEQVLDLLVTAPAETLLMSRKNCHAKNISSIVLRNDNGQLTRMFMTWPNHEIDLVGIHNHLYDISLKLVTGHVQNTKFFINSYSGKEYDHYKFTSAVANGVGWIDRQTNKRLIGAFPDDLKENESLTLGCEELHQISCRKNEKSAWVVREGPRQRAVTDLYTRREVDLAGLYQKFESQNDVIEHVNLFFQEMI